MSTPTLPHQRHDQHASSASPAVDVRQAVDAITSTDGAWRQGYGVGYRHGHHDGTEARDAAILAVTADAAHRVGSTATAGEVEKARGRTDRRDAAWDSYSADTDGHHVWDAASRAALVDWCLESWSEGQ